MVPSTGHRSLAQVCRCQAEGRIASYICQEVLSLTHLSVKLRFSASHCSHMILLIMFHLNPLYYSDSFLYLCISVLPCILTLLLDLSRTFESPVQPSSRLAGLSNLMSYLDLKRLSIYTTDERLKAVNCVGL